MYSFSTPGTNFRVYGLAIAIKSVYVYIYMYTCSEQNVFRIVVPGIMQYLEFWPKTQILHRSVFKA